jgi:hypothetical protein
VGTIGACSLWEHVLSDNHLGVMKGPGNREDYTLNMGKGMKTRCKQLSPIVGSVACPGNPVWA